MRVASPPTHADAARTCAVSAISASVPVVLAWPAAAGVATRGSDTTASTTAPRRDAPLRATTSATRPTATASSAWKSQTSPKRVSSTSPTVDGRNVSTKERRPATAPSSRIPTAAATASANAATAIPDMIRRRTARDAVARARTRAIDPPTTRSSRPKSTPRATDSATLSVRGVPRPGTVSRPPGLAPRRLTWKTKAPESGCPSAETTRQATVYVPGSSPLSTATATVRSVGRCVSPRSTRVASAR